MNMTKRDEFTILAANAPNPTEDDIGMQYKLDRMRNPHNDSHKPPLRDRLEIIADYKIAFAKMMSNRIAKEMD